MTIQTIFVDSCAKRMHHLGLQVKLSYDQFGNFVVQKLLETGDLENHLAMLKEVKGHVPRCFFFAGEITGELYSWTYTEAMEEICPHRTPKTQFIVWIQRILEQISGYFQEPSSFLEITRVSRVYTVIFMEPRFYPRTKTCHASGAV